jgi:hypothetical protein
MCILQGVTIDHVLAIPTCGFAKSSRLKPTACSIARLAARSRPSTVWLEYGLGSEMAGFRVFALMLGCIRATHARRQDAGGDGKVVANASSPNPAS